MNHGYRRRRVRRVVFLAGSTDSRVNGLVIGLVVLVEVGGKQKGGRVLFGLEADS